MLWLRVKFNDKEPKEQVAYLD